VARKPDLEKRAELARRSLAWIAEHGVSKVTMRSLARGLGMKRPTLYWYYKDLGEIFDAIFEAILAEQAVFFAERLAPADHPLDHLAAYVRTTVDFGRPRRAQILAIFQLWAVSRAGAADQILARGRRFMEPIREALIAVVRGGIETGRIAETDPATLVDVVLTFCDGMAVQRITRNPDPTAAVELFCRAVLEPLRQEPALAGASANARSSA
jgi:AcrR family transcriptional regulator